MISSKKIIGVAVLIVLEMSAVRLLAKYPLFVETYYSNGLYPILSKASRWALGWIPFSFGDLMYIVAIFLILRALFFLIKRRFRESRAFLYQALSSVAIVYAAFHLLWGMNYYRLPLHQSIDIDNQYTTSDLLVLSEKLLDKANSLHQQLAPSDSAAVVYAFAKADIYKQSLKSYPSLQAQFPSLTYEPESIKTSLLSYPLSIMGYSGYLNPITNEAQVNGCIPRYRLPVVSSHEQAHQLGYAKENEANFFAVLASLNNDDPYFQYSGTIFALRYCLNDIYSRDRAQGEAFRSRIRPGIISQYRESQEFWQRMDNPLEPFFKLFYTEYLKANNQPEGMKSYSYMVALLVNYNKKFPSAI